MFYLLRGDFFWARQVESDCYGDSNVEFVVHANVVIIVSVVGCECRIRIATEASILHVELICMMFQVFDMYYCARCSM